MHKQTVSCRLRTITWTDEHFFLYCYCKSDDISVCISVNIYMHMNIHQVYELDLSQAAVYGELIDGLTGVSLWPKVLQEYFPAEFIIELRQYNQPHVKPIKESVRH